MRPALSRLRRDWTRLGDTDPLWAVCVDPARKDGRWDLSEFNASGKTEIAFLIGELDRLGLGVRRERALDFGCGVGRLSGALLSYYGSVTGVDISPPMVELAGRLNPGCDYVLNDAPDLRLAGDASFDLVYSSLVLQHIPPALARGYLAEFVRVARPGGVIALLVPVSYGWSAPGLAYRLLPSALAGFVQRRCFGYPAPMRMRTLPARQVERVVAPLGARLVASVPHPGYGGPWRMALQILAR